MPAKVLRYWQNTIMDTDKNINQTIRHKILRYRTTRQIIQIRNPKNMIKNEEILGLISEVEQKMRHPQMYRISNPAWRLTPREEREDLLADFYSRKQFVLNWTFDSEGHCRRVFIAGCVFFEERLWLIMGTDNDGVKDTMGLRMLPENLLQPNEETAVWWGPRVPIMVGCFLRNTLEHFKREGIANTGLTIERSWTLAELGQRFREAFEAELWIYEGLKRVCNDTRRIEELEGAVKNTLVIHGVDQVGDIIQRLQELLGFTVRIRDKRFGKTPPDNLPLYIVRDISRRRPQHRMKPLKPPI